MSNDKDALEQIVLTRLMRLNTMIYGIVGGLVMGLGIFIATNWLLIKGGPIGPEGEPVIGPHLWLLSHFFIGYKVSFGGSLIGFAYAFVVGFLIGYTVATMYNWLIDLKKTDQAKLEQMHKEPMPQTARENQSTTP